MKITIDATPGDIELRNVPLSRYVKRGREVPKRYHA